MSDPAQSLNAFLVGGAVRDEVMGRDVKDRDWVVVGETPERMMELGFKPVGRDFPVFLHPATHEEYALARSERKISAGYQGFEFYCGTDVTLEQDLSRRDLTINAMARDGAGSIYDPFGGLGDIEQKHLRHVSNAFVEDPVRILRIARFAARFAGDHYTVHPDTLVLMKAMVARGEVDALVSERVWQEMAAALPEPGFFRFIEVLRACRALQRILPEVDALFGVPQNPQYHPEIDTGIHTLMSLKALAQLGGDSQSAFAVLMHDLGKALTPKEKLPAHHQHEARGVVPINALCDRLRVPNRFRELALMVCKQHLNGHRIAELRASTVVSLLERLDGFRNPANVEKFALCCLADRRGRTGMHNAAPESTDMLLAFHRAALAVDAGKIARELARKNTGRRISGEAIKNKIRAARAAAVKRARANWGD